MLGSPPIFRSQDLSLLIPFWIRSENDSPRNHFLYSIRKRKRKYCHEKDISFFIAPGIIIQMLANLEDVDSNVDYEIRKA